MNMKSWFRIVVLGALMAASASTVARAADIQWEKVVIDRGMSEGCSVFDVNGDGLLDIVCLPYWYRAPFWDKRPLHDIVKSGEFMMNYGQIPMDVNGDGAMDVVSAGWFDKDIFWYENPFAKPMPLKTINDEYKEWKQWLLPQPPSLGGGCEAILGVDVDGDGKIDVVPNRRPLGWYAVNPKGADGQPEWTRFPVDLSGRKSTAWLHGLGFGDINGDGRKDLVTGEGWWEAPANPRTDKWIEHAEFKMPDAGIPMIVTDLDGDGDNDIIYGEGHAYGIFWMEQVKEGETRKWDKHEIDKTASQYHALVWVDLDGDGQNELVIGKRWRGHGNDDPGSFDPLGVYYFKWDRAKKTWDKHIISYDDHVGVGMQICVVDMDGDGDLDVVCPGKSGLYLMKNLTISKPVKLSETIYKPLKK